MQFKVPQDVQQADRIVSFLTLPQLIICIIGFAIAYGVYAALNNQGLPLVFWLPPVLFIGALTLAFAFLKIANLPFHYYLALLIERFMTPSKRVWVKGSDRVITEEAYVSPEEKKNEEKAKKLNELQQQKEEKLQNISQITDVLDTLKKEPEPEVLKEIDTTDDKELLQKAFLDESPNIKASAPEQKTEMKSEVPAEETVNEPSKPEIIPSAPSTNESMPKKKRKRRRRRKKKSGNQLPTAASAPAANAAPTTTKEATAEPVKPKQEEAPAVPTWLEEKSATLTTDQQETRAVSTTPSPAPEPEPLATPEPTTVPEPVASETPSALDGIATEKTEELLEAPEPEELLEAPEEELDLPAPEEELELSAPQKEPSSSEKPAEETEFSPTSPTIPTTPPPKTIQIEETFTPDELKQGQVIKIPKRNS